MADDKHALEWTRAMALDELSDGRVKPVTCHHRTQWMTHYQGQYVALDDKCPHQGGPLAEGSIENGLLRCSWHGWDFDPLTGKPPGYDDGVDTSPIEVREDGVYVGFPKDKAHTRTVAAAGQPRGCITPQEIAPPPQSVDRAVDLLSRSRRPVIIVGHGARFHMPGVIALAEMMHCASLTRLVPEDAIITVDVGNNTYSLLCGALGVEVKTKEELDAAIGTALAHAGVSLVEIHSDVELV